MFLRLFSLDSGSENATIPYSYLNFHGCISNYNPYNP